MLQAFSFQAEPIVGHPKEEEVDLMEGFIICSAPDPEAFLRDRLSELGLTLLEVHYTDSPSPERVQGLPETERSALVRDGFCMVLQEKYRE